MTESPQEVGRLTGTQHVRIVRECLKDGHRLFPKTRDRMEFRRHLLKLRYWPERHPQDHQGTVLDVDWEKVKSLAGLDVFELRVTDTIGGHDNLRAYFYTHEQQDAISPMPCLWILHAMQKKRNDLTKFDLSILKARRLTVRRLVYGVNN